MSEWLPIETAPKDGTRVLLNDINGSGEPWVVLGQFEGGIWTSSQYRAWDYQDGELLEFGYPTHWMPLPSPPKGHQP